MKTNKIIVLFSMLMLVVSSCSGFLDEELKTQRSTDFYQTEEGIQSLVTGAYYQSLCVLFRGEISLCYFNSGTDELTVGGDPSNAVWNSYDGGLKSIVTKANVNTIGADDVWNNLYVAINSSNVIIDEATTIQSTNDAIKKTALGEGYFFRAYNYFRLASLYGGVPLKLKPSSSVEFEFTRASAAETVNQVVSDFEQAYNLLPETAAKGKLTKSAAAHFLAKAKLFRASEINDSWNGSTKEADLKSVVSLADEVIAKHPLANNYSDLWAYTKNDDKNETLDEIILAAQYSSDLSTKGVNTQHMYFLSKYDDLAQMKRDITGGRPYSRLRPTGYMYYLYDMVQDSRFWKSFKTKDRVNNASGGYYANGDLGIMYIINKMGDNRFGARTLNNKVIYEKTGKTIPWVFVAYPKGANDDSQLYADVRFPSLNKYIDASRSSINETRGNRDIVLARSAETYLMAAEAEVRLAKLGKASYEDALKYINPVRQRATYKSGEDRSVYIDGGSSYLSSTSGQDPNLNSYYPENSYYESNGIEKTKDKTDLTVKSVSQLPSQDEEIIKKLGYTDNYDRMLCFILDEKSRELCGEFHRWADLSRTKTLVKRAIMFNPGSQSIKDYHCLRPIPQTYLDAVQKDGRALTSEEKQAQQNPGY